MNVLLVGNGNIGQKIQEIANKNNIEITGIIDKKHFSYNEKNCYDGIIDFSSPKLLDTSLSIALKKKIPLILGTTGYDELQKEKIKTASINIPIGFDANFSCGFHFLKKCHDLIKNDPHIQDEYLMETHRRDKKDTPSGSSYLLSDSKTKILSLRGGSTPGEHIVRFFLDGEEFILTHRVYDRTVFAQGAIDLLKKISSFKKGLFRMEDILENT